MDEGTVFIRHAANRISISVINGIPVNWHGRRAEVNKDIQ